MIRPLFKAPSLNRFLRFTLCIGALVCGLSAAGQVDTTTTLQQISADTTLTKSKNVREVMVELGERIRGDNIQKYTEGRNSIKQENIIRQIKRLTLQAGDFEKTDIDTIAIWNDFHIIDSLFELAGEGIFKKPGYIQTHRNLTVSNTIISVLLSKSRYRKKQVDEYREKLAGYKFQLDSLSADSVLYELPADSATFSQYTKTLFLTAAEIGPADSAIQRSLENVQELQILLTLQVNKLNTALQKIDASDATLSDNIFKRELVNIWVPIPYSRLLSEILAFSKQKNSLALNYYAKNNNGLIAFCLLVIIGLALVLITLKRRLSRANELRADLASQLIFKYPITSAIFIGVNLLQFLFKSPPFIFGMIFWIISSLCLTRICWASTPKSLRWFWIAINALFVVGCTNNLILQSSRQERWGMVLLAIGGISAGIYFLLKAKRGELKENTIVYFMAFVVFLDFFSLIFNVFGRYNLAKILLTSGYINAIIAIQFLWTAKLIQGMLVSVSWIYGGTDEEISYEDFERSRNKVPVIFYLLLLLGWFVLFARNFYAFHLITDPITNMLAEERKVGNLSFTIDNVLVFVVIIAISAFLSKIISFFTAHKAGTIPDKNSTKSKMGSWVLLIRIAIISMGLFLAAAAAGIPLDRVSLVLGALGVGIGFGLQDLTSSLVSGIILAFEKPVNVGDIVEVADQSGTMKSIGFRSSVITNSDGADVIIPNNTLLSSNLTNWTKSDEKRRVEIDVHVLYGADLKKVKTILMELLNADERILKQPAPSVEFMELKNSIVDLRIYFWLLQVQEWGYTRSDVIEEIDRVLKENNIAMPLPPS